MFVHIETVQNFLHNLGMRYLMYLKLNSPSVTHDSIIATQKFIILISIAISFEIHHFVLDAVGSWQIILPMPNLERTY